MIYLDNAATSPVDEEVLEAMLPYLKEEYGNPSGKYYCTAVNAKKAVEDAREKVSRLIGAKSEEIVFTSGATESTNFIIKGFMDYSRYYGSGRTHIITSKADHKATLNTCRFLNGEIYSNHDATIALFAANKRIDRGFSADFLGVSENGAVEQDTVKNAINDNTAMASFMLVNNETGAVTDIAPISVLCREKGVALHVDATQALGKLDVNVDTIDCDFLSASAHKLYGPKGVGCAYIRSDKYGLPPITSLLHGGEQEFGIRGGTLAVHNIVGFGKAAEIATRDMEKNEKLICELDEYLIAGLSQIHDVLPLIDPRSRVKGIISLLVKRRNFNNERFIKRVSSEVAISTGSACSAGEPSHVIAAIGQKENVSKIIRVSLNKYTTKSNIDCLIRLLTK